MTASTNESFGWDEDVATSDAGAFALLRPGPCRFRINEFKRGRHEGSARMAACYQAELKLTVTDPDGNVSEVGCNLPLNRKMAWKITGCFKATGLLDPATPSGTTVRYPWDRLPGAQGYCEIEHYDWTGDDGQARKGNSVKGFLYGDRATEAARLFGPPQAAPRQAAQRPYGGTF
jgi:hypothetical protein